MFHYNLFVCRNKIQKTPSEYIFKRLLQIVRIGDVAEWEKTLILIKDRKLEFIFNFFSFPQGGEMKSSKGMSRGKISHEKFQEKKTFCSKFGTMR